MLPPIFRSLSKRRTIHPYYVLKMIVRLATCIQKGCKNPFNPGNFHPLLFFYSALELEKRGGLLYNYRVTAILAIHLISAYGPAANEKYQ